MSDVVRDPTDPILLSGDRRHPLPRRASAASMSVLVHAVLIAAAAVSLFPFVWLICASLKTNRDLFRFLLLPHGTSDGVTFGHYATLFTTRPFGRWMLNSLYVSCAHTVIVVTLSSLAGFALAKYRFRGRGLVLLLMLATLTIPSQVMLPSAFRIVQQLGWLDSYAAILVPGAVSVFGVFLFSRAMRTVPDELLQAARLDGCSELRLWWTVALPIVRPMVGAFTLLTFMGSWNSFLWPQIVLRSDDQMLLPVGLSGLTGLPPNEAPYGLLMAGTLLSVLPVVILFIALQRDFVAGLASGAMKG